MQRPIKVIHIITGLSVGGTEIMLSKILGKTNRNTFNPIVISLRGEGLIYKNIQSLGIQVVNLGMGTGIKSFLRFIELIKYLKNESPDIIQTWMYHADLLGGLCGRMVGIRRILWNIRNTRLGLKYNRLTTLIIVKLCALLSHWIPIKIISCSQAARDVHVKMGYARDRFVIIPNGVDSSIFRPNARARDDIRKELSINPHTPLVGLIARYAPIKDHQTFFKAAGMLSRINPDVHFLLCGEGMTGENKEVVAKINEYDIVKQVHLLGTRRDVAAITSALDIAVSSSVGEAFPNVVAEAMSCGVPCVATNVGDSALIIGDTGIIVPSANPRHLADAILELLKLPREERRKMGERARQRIQDNFEISKTVTAYENLYQEIFRNRNN